MIGWLGVGVLLAAAACASTAVAQLPISPVYRPGPEQAQPAPDRGGASGEGPYGGDGRRAGECAARETGSRRTAAGSHGADPAAASARRRRQRGRGDALSRRCRAHPNQSPQETTPKGQASTTTAATPPPRPSAPAPVSSESEAKQHPAATPETAPTSSRETKTGRSEAGSRNGTKKDRVQSERRQARTGRHASRRGPVYHSWPYYARSLGAYPDRTRGYGGGLYGPSPYSSEGP